MRNKAKLRHDPEKRARRAAANNPEVADAAAEEKPEAEGEEGVSEGVKEQAVEEE